MSSSARINENGYLAAVPESTPAVTLAPDSPAPDSSLGTPWRVMHSLLDYVLEGDTEAALRSTASLEPEEIKFFAEKLDELRTILTARIAVRYMGKMPEVQSMLRDFMPHLFEAKAADPSAP